ncbi:AsnC family protein [Streptomyces sp. NPDC002491]
MELAVRCAPGSLRETAAALAARADTRSVEISTGAPEVFTELLIPDHDALLTAIDGSIGRIPGVVDIHSSVVLRPLLTANDWAPYDDGPTPVRRRLVEGTDLPAPLAVDDLDRWLVELLERDARTPMAQLSDELCSSRTFSTCACTSSRRRLRFPSRPASSSPSNTTLDNAVRRLAQELAIPHLVLTTGRADVLGYSSHRSTQDLYASTARVFSELEGLNGAETAVLLRTYKRVGIVTGGTL